MLACVVDLLACVVYATCIAAAPIDASSFDDAHECIHDGSFGDAHDCIEAEGAQVSLLQLGHNLQKSLHTVDAMAKVSTAGQKTIHGSAGMDASLLQASETSSRWLADPGDATCMKWTGGTCTFAECNRDRGDTACVAGYCVCKTGSCANAWGQCKPPGKWLGIHSIEFRRPSQPGVSFLQAPSYYCHRGWPCLYASPDDDPQWKVAMDSDGLLRLESRQNPGYLLGFYDNRRRRTDGRRRSLIQQAEQTRKADQRFPNSDTKVNVTVTKGIDRLHLETAQQSKHFVATGSDASVSLGDNADLMPTLLSIHEATPYDVVFQAINTSSPGVQLWHPKERVMLASSRGSYFFYDSFRGVSDCSPYDTLWDSCYGRQDLLIQPALPPEAFQRKDALYIYPVSGFSWSVFGYVVLAVILIGACVFAVMRFVGKI